MAREDDDEQRDLALGAIAEVMEDYDIDLKDLETKVTKRSPKVGSYTRDDVDAAYQRGRDRVGSDGEFARQLYDDNYKQREEIRKLKEQLPGDGGQVLSKAEAADWEAYKKLGKPKDIETAVGERDTLKQENETHERETTLRDVADVVEPGVKFKFSVLKDLDSRSQLEYEKKVEEEEGVVVTRVYVKYKDGDTTKEAKLLTYAREKWGDYLPSLVLNGHDDTHQQPMLQGTLYPEQPGSGLPPEKIGAGQTYFNSRYGHNAPKEAGK